LLLSYVVYLDPEGENTGPSGNYHLYTKAASDYIQDADNFPVFHIEVSANVDATSPSMRLQPGIIFDHPLPKVDANLALENSSIITALIDDLAITNDKIQNLEITGGKIVSTTLIERHYSSESVTSDVITNGTITGKTFVDTGLEIDTEGYIRTTDKDTYLDDTAGFWLGKHNGVHKLNIGDDTRYIKWDGTSLSVKGTVTIEDGEIAGLTLAPTKMYFGTSPGTHKHVNTPFYVDSSGNFSLGALFSWTASTAIVEVKSSATGARIELTGTGLVQYAANNDEQTSMKEGSVLKATGGIFKSNATIARSGSAGTAIASGTTGVIVDDAGIIGGADGATQFYLLASDGKAYFGGGACFLDVTGVHLGGTFNTALSYKFGGGDYGWIRTWSNYSSDSNNTPNIRRGLFFDSVDEDSDALTDPEENYLAPQTPGVMGLGHRILSPWGTIYANLHYLNIRSDAPGTLHNPSQNAWGAMYIRGTTVYVKIGSNEHTVSGSGVHDHDTANALLYAPITGSNVYGDIDSVNITAGVHLTGNVNTQSGNHIQTIDHIEGGGSYHIPALGNLNQILINNGSNGQVGWANHAYHIPSGGSGSYGSRQVLTYGGNAGQADWASAAAHGVHGGGGTINSGITNKFAYYSGSTTLSASSGAGIISLYCNNIYSSGAYLFFGGMPVGVARDVQYSTGGYMYYDGSSRRYKENIVELAVDSSKIYELVPKSFKMKDMEHPTMTDDGEEDFDTMVTEIGLTTFGYIAEEVHEVLPELVLYNEDNEPDAIRYKTISVLLIEEMKKLRARIEVLEGNG